MILRTTVRVIARNDTAVALEKRVCTPRHRVVGRAEWWYSMFRSHALEIPHATQPIKPLKHVCSLFHLQYNHDSNESNIIYSLICFISVHPAWPLVDDALLVRKGRVVYACVGLLRCNMCWS